MNRIDFLLNPLHGKVLDVGYVSGTLHERVLERLDKKQVFGLDTETKKENALYKRGSAERMPYPAKSFDSILAGELIEHLNHPEQFVAESARVLKKGGLLCLSTPNRNSWVNRLTKSYHTPVHLHLFDRKELTQLLRENGFEIVGFRHFPYTEESSDGARHKSMFAIRKAVHHAVPSHWREEMAVVAKKQ